MKKTLNGFAISILALSAALLPGSGEAQVITERNVSLQAPWKSAPRTVIEWLSLSSIVQVRWW